MVSMSSVGSASQLSALSGTSGNTQSIAGLEKLLDQLMIRLIAKLISTYLSNSSGGTPALASANSSNTLPTVTSNNAAQAVTTDLEQRYGLNATQAAGALGNLQQESGMECNVNQGGAKGEPCGQGGYGLAQWGGSRQAGEIAYAKAHHVDPGSLQANIGYMNQELDGPYNKTIRDLKQATNTSQAAQIWDTDYEQAGTPVMANRDRYAAQYASEGL